MVRNNYEMFVTMVFFIYLYKILTLFSSVIYRIRYLLLARMLRLIRLLMHVQQYRAFIATFITLIPSLMPYLGTIFCVLCIYCSIGVQVNHTTFLPLKNYSSSDCFSLLGSSSFPFTKSKTSFVSYFS